MLLIFTQIIKSNSTVISKPPLTNIIFNMLSWNTTVPWIWQAYYLEVHDSFKKKNLWLSANNSHLSILKCVIKYAFVKPNGLCAFSKLTHSPQKTKTPHLTAEQLDLEYNWTTYFRTACIFTCRPNLDFITIFLCKQNIIENSKWIV